MAGAVCITLSLFQVERVGFDISLIYVYGWWCLRVPTDNERAVFLMVREPSRSTVNSGGTVFNLDG